MKLSKRRRSELRMKFGGECAYCGCELPETGWHADHVKAVWRDWEFVKDAAGVMKTRATGKLFAPENDTAENLFPACAPCNISKGAESLDAWRGWLNDRIVRVLRDNSASFRHAERFGRVIANPEPLVFWFEKFKSGA